jgi:hypothetical protein
MTKKKRKEKFQAALKKIPKNTRKRGRRNTPTGLKGKKRRESQELKSYLDQFFARFSLL